MAPPITQRVIELRRAPSLAQLLRVAGTIVAQRRTLEIAHGLGCLMIRRPGPVVTAPFDTSLFDALVDVAARLARERPAAWQRRFPLIRQWLPRVVTRSHGACRVGEYTVVGEYGERAARLFLLSADQMAAYDDYVHCPGVRHIHCVHPIDDRRFLVSTGDSSRFLDRWVIERGRLRFEKRLMRWLGGFTAAARVGDEIYLGTDFSGRPNYLMRLSDRRRFYLPAEAFRKWVVRMEAVADRYLIVLSKDLNLAGGTNAFSVFDARGGCFVSNGEFEQSARCALVEARGQQRRPP